MGNKNIERLQKTVVNQKQAQMINELKKMGLLKTPEYSLVTPSNMKEVYKPIRLSM